MILVTEYRYVACLNPHTIIYLHDSELDETHGRGVVKSHGLEVLAANVTLLKFGLLVSASTAGLGLGLDLGLGGLGISRSFLGHGTARNSRKGLLGAGLRLSIELGRRLLLGGETLGAVNVLLDVLSLPKLAFVELGRDATDRRALASKVGIGDSSSALEHEFEAHERRMTCEHRMGMHIESKSVSVRRITPSLSSLGNDN